MADVVIFGVGQVAEVIWHYLEHESPHRPVAFTVDAEYQTADELLGLPVVPFERVHERFPPEQCAIFVAVAYRKLNRIRADKLAEAEAKGYRAISHVSPRAVVPPGFEPGPNSFIMEHNTVQPFVTVGRNVVLWSGNHIGHHSAIADNVFIASHVVISGAVKVGANTFIGVNATLRDGITIGSHNIIGAGALILKDTEDFAVYPGKATDPAPLRSDRLRG
jgi:sugar O-acyltransferase (sialic acid O-acetyltransferase NeuD family)